MKKVESQKLLSTYPRSRPPLTPDHEKVYVDQYKLNRSGKGLMNSTARAMERWMHRQVAKPKNSGSILEIGAGSLNHVRYEVETNFYDCVEPFKELFEDSPYRHLVGNIYRHIEEVPRDSSYHRIISIAVLEHLVNLPRIVAYSGLLLAPRGFFQAGLPSEGGLLWGLSWRLTTGLAYRLRTGLDYKTFMRHEHVNAAPEIIEVVRYFFSTVKTKRTPLPFTHLSFYTYLEAQGPRRELCQAFLDSSICT